MDNRPGIPDRDSAGHAMTGTDWDAYLGQYHQDHPGITETALAHAHHPIHGSAHQWLAAVVPKPAGDVLDLASGSCPMQPLMQYRTYLAVERSPAEREAATALGRGPVVAGDVTDLDLPDASVDTVVMAMALMLVPLPHTLTQVARVLRPGGTFVAMVPATWPVKLLDMPAVAVLSAALRGPGSMPRQLTARTLRPALAKAGLNPTSLSRQRFPFPVADDRDARLAVASLYTPGRTSRQLRNAEAWLTALPGRTELPVPLMRVTARRDGGPSPTGSQPRV